MILVEKHIIKNSHPEYQNLMYMLHLSKNLYNAALYDIRQHYFSTGEFKSWMCVDREFIQNNNPDYRALKAFLSKSVMKKVGEQFSSYFALLEKKKVGQYERSVNIPKYKPKDGHFVLDWEGRLISQKHLKNGIVNPLGTDLMLKFNKLKCLKDSDGKYLIYSDGKLKTNVRCIRVIPLSNQQICVEICYSILNVPIKQFNGTIAGVDLGVNNLFCVGINNQRGFVIKGKKLKSINQYYNKKQAIIKSELNINHNKNQKSVKNQYKSKRLTNLTTKRNNKINDYLHKATTMCVNQIVSRDVTLVVIGENDDWKQDINIGRRNNQNFVYIPHARAIEMLKYKLELKGIEVIITEESYTSKSSFLDNDPIPVYKKGQCYKFSGERQKRGLYISASG